MPLPELISGPLEAGPGARGKHDLDDAEVGELDRVEDAFGDWVVGLLEASRCPEAAGGCLVAGVPPRPTGLVAADADFELS